MFPPQDRKAAGGLQRAIGERLHDALALALDRLRGMLADRAPRHRLRVAVQDAGVEQPLQHQWHAARFIEIGRDVLPARLQVAQQRRALGDAVKLLDRERHADFPRDREQVQHGVGRAAAHGHRGDRVLERRARDDLARPLTAAQHVHHQFAHASSAAFELAPILGRGGGDHRWARSG